MHNDWRLMQETITARFADALPPITPQAGGDVPGEIQFMPPGKNRIVAWKQGKPFDTTVNATPDAVDALNAALAKDPNQRPWFDFDHREERASGWPTKFYWGGDDPQKGGIRCTVEWSASGAEAIKGRDYRHFSPAFLTDRNGKVIGAPQTMGGLVNDPAFRTREPLWSRDASQHANEHTNMSEPNLAELQAKLSALEKENQELKAKLASSEQDTTIKARDAEISELKGKIVKFEEVIGAHKKEKAKALVDAAIRAKRLPPQAAEIHAKWQKLIEQDEANAALLDSLPEVDPTGAVVKAGAAGAATPAPKSTEEKWGNATGK